MGRYTGPVCRLCRRVGEKLFLKGERCFTPRCAIERRRPAPGQHVSRRRRPSDFAVHLLEKQKARYVYGMMENQFRRYMEEAFSNPSVTGPYLLQLLERRLDNVLYRLSFADSRRQARQLALHGHFTLNGKSIIGIPSYPVKVGDVIAWKESRKEKDFFKKLTEGLPRRPVPEWLSLDTQNMTGKVLRLPEAREATNLDTKLIVEFYSR